MLTADYQHSMDTRTCEWPTDQHSMDRRAERTSVWPPFDRSLALTTRLTTVFVCLCPCVCVCRCSRWAATWPSWPLWRSSPSWCWSACRAPRASCTRCAAAGTAPSSSSSWACCSSTSCATPPCGCTSSSSPARCGSGDPCRRPPNGSAGSAKGRGQRQRVASCAPVWIALLQGGRRRRTSLCWQLNS